MGTAANSNRQRISQAIALELSITDHFHENKANQHNGNRHQRKARPYQSPATIHASPPLLDGTPNGGWSRDEAQHRKGNSPHNHDGDQAILF